jgi:hypothetical protein
MHAVRRGALVLLALALAASGSPVGGCIAGKFRAARIPAFEGAPVTVGKSFTVN